MPDLGGRENTGWPVWPAVEPVGAVLFFLNLTISNVDDIRKGNVVFHSILWRRLLEAAVLSRMRLDAAGKTRFSVQPVVSDTQRQQEALRMELAALEKKLQRLRDAFLCGAEGIQEYKREKERLTAQANHLRQELLSSSREVCAASEQHDEIQKIVTTLEDPTSGTEEKYRAAHHVLESCIWNKEEGVVRLVYRLRL